MCEIKERPIVDELPTLQAIPWEMLAKGREMSPTQATTCRRSDSPFAPKNTAKFCSVGHRSTKRDFVCSSGKVKIAGYQSEAFDCPARLYHAYHHQQLSTEQGRKRSVGDTSQAATSMVNSVGWVMISGLFLMLQFDRPKARYDTYTWHSSEHMEYNAVHFRGVVHRLRFEWVYSVKDRSGETRNTHSLCNRGEQVA
ncbi:hypothetical protein VFPPC_02315 [Pochonia chlamydosporia 170]|uniref:Uncharacterized protein n=1 Tax=Pochonia chlamydosporia 170 TaxID=1380566 RepID=A0A179FVP3_METCM|nr:hypothetical protein VFPPC_02315 [Pochonia chlamydosporia 170]OAQ69726.2 hypothetical protein VFPPC_02315 [Pochonia chlamydosporia 170]